MAPADLIEADRRRARVSGGTAAGKPPIPDGREGGDTRYPIEE
jgi:hypothetical protein